MRILMAIFSSETLSACIVVLQIFKELASFYFYTAVKLFKEIWKV
jgi:hypothetical protein